MKVLFATHNEAKKKMYNEKFKNCDLEIISLEDLSIDFDVLEDGNSSKENAITKAKEYYQIAKIPTIAIDDGLELDNIPENIQPGTHVRRINGEERATDEEVIEYYTSLVNKYGNNGKLNGRFNKCIAIALNEEDVRFMVFPSERVFYDKIIKEYTNGYPLGAISKRPEYALNQEKENEENIEKFIKTSFTGCK